MPVESGGRPPAPAVTALDVLEGFFGELPDEATVLALPRTRVELLGERVREFAAVTAGTSAPASTYPGGWLASGWNQQPFRGDLNLAVLYYSRLLIHDPLADFFFRSGTHCRSSGDCAPRATL